MGRGGGMPGAPASLWGGAGGALGGESSAAASGGGGGDKAVDTLLKNTPSVAKMVAQAAGVPGANRLPGVGIPGIGAGFGGPRGLTGTPGGPPNLGMPFPVPTGIPGQDLTFGNPPISGNQVPGMLPLWAAMQGIGGNAPPGSMMPSTKQQQFLQAWQGLPQTKAPTPGELQQLPGPWNAGHFASGGSVDTVPAMLSPGEFVMKQSAVQKYGTAFMSNVNAGKFASGGTVPLTPSMVGSVPTSVSHSTSGASPAIHVDARTIVSGNSLADAYQLAKPIQEINNSKVYSRAQFGGLPIATGPGGG
jgi:hypothetical protein